MPARYGNSGQPGMRIGWRLTRAVKWLLIINGAVYLLELIIGKMAGEEGVIFLYRHLAVSFSGVFERGEIWQPVSYMFLHDATGISHILWNMLMLWMFGSPLESFWGKRGFLKFYFVCGIISAGVVLAAGLCFPDQRDVPTLGASGALYALLVAFGFNFPRSPIYLFGLFPMLGKHLVLLFIGLGLLQSLTLSARDVSLAAHLGGLAAGALVASGAWRPRRAAHYLRLGWLKLRHWRLKRRLRLLDKDPPEWRH